MKWTRSRGLVAVALMALAALAIIIVAGCGSSSSSSSSSPTPSASATTATGSWTTADLAALQTDAALKAMLPSSIVSANNLRVASDVPYAPWEFYDPATSKNPAGFDFDLSQAIGAKLGVTASFINTPFDTIIISVTGGKNDMIMADMYDNTDREKTLTFVDYAYDGTSILVLKGNPNGLTNLDSLAGKTVAVLSGSSQQALLQ